MLSENGPFLVCAWEEGAWGRTQTKVPKVSIISPLNYSISQKASPGN